MLLTPDRKSSGDCSERQSKQVVPRRCWRQHLGKPHRVLFHLAWQVAPPVFTRGSTLQPNTKPLFNLVITNVPGPQVDLFVAGHKLLSTMGMAPIVDGMGLIITVLSYNGVLSLSPTSSASVMPDIDLFARLLRDEANILETAVQAENPDRCNR